MLIGNSAWVDINQSNVSEVLGEYCALTPEVHNEIVPAVFLRITADESRSEDVTRLRPLGAYLSLAFPRSTLRVVGIVEYRVRPFAQPLSKRGELDIWIG